MLSCCALQLPSALSEARPWGPAKSLPLSAHSAVGVAHFGAAGCLFPLRRLTDFQNVGALRRDAHRLPPRGPAAALEICRREAVSSRRAGWHRPPGVALLMPAVRRPGLRRRPPASVPRAGLAEAPEEGAEGEARRLGRRRGPAAG